MPRRSKKISMKDIDMNEATKILTSKTTRGVMIKKLSQLKIGNKCIGTMVATNMYNNYRNMSHKIKQVSENVSTNVSSTIESV